MEMQEKKKFMPTITNYLSDDDDFDECLQINSNSTQLQTNYKEWKKMQQTNSETTNGKRPRMRSDGSMEPLGDISSSEETYGIEDNDPMFKIIKTLSDKEVANRRNQRIRKKFKEPSMFLLFSRMKHLKYQNSSQDWTFNELCRVTHSSWENIQPSEQEELNDTLDQKIREYRESLQKFRSVLLPDANNRLKYKSWVSAAAANKGHLVSPVVNDLKESSQTIPERLQNLVGKASIYHASVTPNKSNHNSRHSLFSFRSTTANNNDYLTETSLNYVANAMETCKYDSCTNKPVQDNRWDGQYCSAKCLINDCRDTFQNWLADQKQQTVVPSSETNGTNSKSSRLSSAGDDEEIMQYLATPPTAENNNNNSDDDSEDSINRDENLFASLQQHYFPGENIVDIIRPSNDELQMSTYGFTTHRHITDIDDEDNEDGVVMLSSPIKLQNNNSQVLPDLSTSTNQRLHQSSVAVISSSASSHSDR